ncbi:MAG TPA: hypothetical protein VGO51_16205 [Burkholderiaceae bacterium]|jgi:hypothetical protein|nr:hypothetical protein [Burkholderiaceae bacterium]
MKQSLHALLAALLTTLAACATFGFASVNPGDSEADVVAKLGPPTHRYQDGKDHLLEYMNGPFGQTTYMARIGPEGRLISYEQVLTTQKFGTLPVGQATKEDVLRTVGAPSETIYLTLSQLEVWSYPYRESDVWDSVMSIHFDNGGIVRRLQNGPDPRRDPDSRWPFAFRRR